MILSKGFGECGRAARSVKLYIYTFSAVLTLKACEVHLTMVGGGDDDG